jgi:hypothetical protein
MGLCKVSFGYAHVTCLTDNLFQDVEPGFEEFERTCSTELDVVDSELPAPVPALVLTFPTPELSRTMPLTVSALVGEYQDAQHSARSSGIELISDGFGVMHAHNNGTDYSFLADGAPAAEPQVEGYTTSSSSKFTLAMVRVKENLARLFPIGLRKGTRQVDGMEVDLAAGLRTRRADRDGSFVVGRRISGRWMAGKVSSSTRAGMEHFMSLVGANAKRNATA